MAPHSGDDKGPGPTRQVRTPEAPRSGAPKAASHRAFAPRGGAPLGPAAGALGLPGLPVAIARLAGRCPIPTTLGFDVDPRLGDLGQQFVGGGFFLDRGREEFDDVVVTK